MPSLSTAHLCFRSVSHSSLPLFITTNMCESCITVLRVEDGKLADLDSLFRDVFRSHGGPVGHIPQGSVVMAGSVTYLSLYGLSCYTEELLSIRHPRKARTVIPAPVEPLPANIAPVFLTTELEITASLVSELNTLHCPNLTEHPKIKRDSGLPTAGLGGCKLVMVGASQTAKIAALNRHSGTTEYIPLPGQLLSTESVRSLELKTKSPHLTWGKGISSILIFTQIPITWATMNTECLSRHLKTPQDPST